MIYLLGEAPASTEYRQGSFDDFVTWIGKQHIYQLDVETTVTPYWCDKKLITIQFGSHTEDVQWVLQISALTPIQWARLQGILRDPKPLKLAHNAAFECIVLRFHGIVLENVYDTMLAEKVLKGGAFEDDLAYSLAAVTERYLCKLRDKTEQTSFGDDILTEAKVLYAAEDVQDLSHIYRMQVLELGHADLDWVAALENEALIAYSEMTYYGLELDQDMWLHNATLVQPLIDAAEQKLNVWLRQAPFRAKATQLGYISDTDRLTIKWTAPKQREVLLQLIFPDLPGASIGVVRKYIKTNPQHPMIELLKAYEQKDYTLFEQYLAVNHRDKLIELEMLTPADTVTLNWNSVQQVLPLFQVVEPKLKDLSADSLAKTTHPIIKDLEDYKDNLKLASSYGEKFIEKFVEPDGKVRTRFNQVVSTGRISSQAPNMQNIPAKEAVGNRYRNAFTCPEDWMFVDSDFSSQELVCIAHLSKDPVWTEALEKGQDLHSVAAEVVYGRKWKDAAEANCAYYAPDDQGQPRKEKCKCKKHKTMRQACKTINFGLAYGMSAFKLSGTLQISLQEAKQLIEDYFKAFPKIRALLDFLGKFGVRNGYSRTMAPFFRKRYYRFWRSVRKYIEAHLAEIEYNPTLGEIERASKNHPIQGSSADMIKLSTILIMWYIKDNGLQDDIHLVVQVHDQNTTICRKEKSEWWKVEMTRLMEAGAQVFIPSGLLKSETNVTERWSK